MKSGKIWGTSTLIFQTPVIALHRLEVKQGFKCSRHKHQFKYNGFYVESGCLRIHVFKNDYALEDITDLYQGQSMVVKPNEYHYFECPDRNDFDYRPNMLPTIAYEIYYPELLGDDIIRKDVGGPVYPKSEGKAEQPT